MELVKLRLKITRGLEVCVDLDDVNGNVYLTAFIWRRGRTPGEGGMLAYAYEQLTNCRICDNSLWVGAAAFDLTAKHSARVLKELVPLGLRVRSVNDKPANQPAQREHSADATGALVS